MRERVQCRLGGGARTDGDACAKQGVGEEWCSEGAGVDRVTGEGDGSERRGAVVKIPGGRGEIDLSVNGGESNEGEVLSVVSSGRLDL